MDQDFVEVKLVRIEPLFDQLLKKLRQAVLSYFCCMANLEMEAFNEGLAPDDSDYKVFQLEIPATWKKYYTLAGVDNSKIIMQELEKLQQD